MVSDASLAACLAVSLTAWVIWLVIVEFMQKRGLHVKENTTARVISR